MEDIIKNFWLCSLKNDFSDFDWDEAFEEYYPRLYENCNVHGLCEYESFKEYIEEMYGDLEETIPEWAVIKTDFTWIGENSAVNALITNMYEQLNSQYSEGVHGDNKELLDKIENRGNMTEPELIQLFDACIHAQHMTGDILEDIDVDDLRKDTEKEYEEEKSKYVTNISERSS